MNALLFLLSVGCCFCCCHRRCSPPLLDHPKIVGSLSIESGSFLLLHSHRLPSSSSIINPYASSRWLPPSTISRFRPAPMTIYYRPCPVARSSPPFSLVPTRPPLRPFLLRWLLSLPLVSLVPLRPLCLAPPSKIVTTSKMHSLIATAI